METVRWFIRWCFWPVAIVLKLRSDHGEHAIVLSLLGAVCGVFMFIASIIPFFRPDFPFPSVTVNHMVSFTSLTAYMLFGLLLYFGIATTTSEKWQNRGVW